MSALLTLSADRIAAEQRRIEAVVAGHALWRRDLWRFAARCAAGYAAGLVIAFTSLALEGDLAPIALWGGLLLGNGSVFGFFLTLWHREII